METPRDSITISTALEGIFRLSRIMGVYPFNDDFSFKALTLFSSTVIHLLLSTNGIVLTYLIGNIQSYNSTLICLLSIETVYIFLTNVLCTLSLIHNIDSLISINDGIQQIIHRLSDLRITWKWRPKFCQLYGDIVVSTSLLTAMFFTHDDEFESLLALHIMLCYLLLNCIMNQYLILQSSLRSLICELQDSVLDQHLLIDCQCIIQSIWENLNACYGPITFVIVTAMFMRILCHLYIQLGIVFVKKDLPWFYIAVYPIVRITMSTRRTLDKLENLNRVIYGRSLEQPDDEMLDFYLTAKREFVFSASGFFNLDNSLICSMIGAGTTYLVILLQYSVPTGSGTIHNQRDINGTT